MPQVRQSQSEPDDSDSDCSSTEGVVPSNMNNLSDSYQPSGGLDSQDRGHLRGLINAPTEIFAEVASYLMPGDLITLIRTSKSLRRLLLRRSASLIWKRALDNVQGLPPCPSGLCEPQYAALMFSKHCTRCGARAKGFPDPYLRARFCKACLETTLEDAFSRFGGPQIGYNWRKYYLPVTSLTTPTEPMQPNMPMCRCGHNHQLYCFQEDAEELSKVFTQFSDAHGEDALEQWKQDKHKELKAQRKEGDKILAYINSEARKVAVERRNSIEFRLKALGWTDKDLDLEIEFQREWRSLVQVPKSLTERAWTKLLPKLEHLIKTNCTQIIEVQQQEKLDQLLKGTSQDIYLSQAIVDALGPVDVGEFV